MANCLTAFYRVLLLYAAITFSFPLVANAQSVKAVTAEEVRSIMDSSNGPLIVNFWATWCAPCVHEIPWFDSIISSRNTPVRLLLVSLDFRRDFPKNIAAFAGRQGYKGEVVFLNDTNSDHYLKVIEPKWQGGIPASIFIDQSKNYYAVFNHQLPRQRLAIEIDKLLN